MSWWDEVQEKIRSGYTLFTPGRGPQRIGKKQFRILAIEPKKIIISSGSSRIPLEKLCFDKVEEAFFLNPSCWLRVASLHDSEALENSVDQLIREATGSQLARGNYVCAILEKCGFVYYSMRGNQKGIRLVRVEENKGSLNSVRRDGLTQREKSEDEKLLKVWEVIRWLDRARWNPLETKKVIIPGPIFEDLTNSQKILVHWLLLKFPRF